MVSIRRFRSLITKSASALYPVNRWRSQKCIVKSPAVLTELLPWLALASQAGSNNGSKLHGIPSMRETAFASIEIVVCPLMFLDCRIVRENPQDRCDNPSGRACRPSFEVALSNRVFHAPLANVFRPSRAKNVLLPFHPLFSFHHSVLLFTNIFTHPRLGSR
jgi:hypothetical protein